VAQPRFRVRTYLLLAAVALLLIELATYGLWADKAAVGVALRYLPQSGGRDFVWLLTAGLTPDQERMLVEALKAQFRAVYRARTDIPPEHLVWSKSPPPKFLGFDGGFLWNWTQRQRGWLWFRAEFEYWQSNTGAESQSATFIWLFGTWVRVWTGPRAIS
jgi:hypothetical protein